jgi:hypothetical protein
MGGLRHARVPRSGMDGVGAPAGWYVPKEQVSLGEGETSRGNAGAQRTRPASSPQPGEAAGCGGERWIGGVEDWKEGSGFG